MDETPKVYLFSKPDSADLLLQVRGILCTEPVELLDLHPPSLPAAGDPALVLLLLSPGALLDPDLPPLLNRLIEQSVPVVPVVPDLVTYSFAALPSALACLSDRNAVGFEPGQGKSVLEAVRIQLGMDPAPIRRRVFISYRRVDTGTIAGELYDHLWSQHYETFLDTEQIEAGVVVQQRIVEQIADKDLVLLLSSPGASDSKWVRAELYEALARRIPICVVTTGPQPPPPPASDAARVAWDPDDAGRLHQVERLVASCIARRDLFDRRTEAYLKEVVRLKGLKVDELGRRRRLLARKEQRVLLDYENGQPTLERLHRLHLGYVDTRRKRRVRGALLVAGTETIHQETLSAVDWARGKAPLQVLHLLKLYAVLDRLFPGPPAP